MECRKLVLNRARIALQGCRRPAASYRFPGRFTSDIRRTLKIGARGRPYFVANASNRVNQLAVRTVIDLLPQVVDIDVDDVGERIAGKFPNMLDDFGASGWKSLAQH